MQLRNYEIARLRKLAKLCRPGTVLDLGYAQFPNPFFAGLHRVGMDLSEPPPDLEYEEAIVGDVADFGRHLGDRQFDNVVAGEFIEHLENPYLFLRDVRRHIAPGGQLLISTPNPVSFPVLLFEWAWSTRFYYTKHHTYLFPPRWVARMLDFSGFELVSVKGVGIPMPLITPPCPATLSYQTIFIAHPRNE